MPDMRGDSTRISGMRPGTPDCGSRCAPDSLSETSALPVSNRDRSNDSDGTRYIAGRVKVAAQELVLHLVQMHVHMHVHRSIFKSS